MRKSFCLHLPENSSKDRVLHFTQIAQFIIYRFFIDLMLNCWRNSLSKILVEYPINSFGSANYWIQEMFRKSRVRTKNRQINVAQEADIAKLNFTIFLKKVIFRSDFFVSKFLGNESDSKINIKTVKKTLNNYLGIFFVWP